MNVRAAGGPLSPGTKTMRRGGGAQRSELKFKPLLTCVISQNRHLEKKNKKTFKSCGEFPRVNI